MQREQRPAFKNSSKEMVGIAEKSQGLSIIIPALNEERNILHTVGQLLGMLEREFPPINLDFEIIVVDDNSTDQTFEILTKFIQNYRKLPLPREKPKIRVFRNPHGPAFGRALKLGFYHARQPFVLPVMADGCDSPKDILKLAQEIHNGYNFIIGTRYTQPEKIIGMPFLKRLASRGFTVFAALLGIPCTDLTNALKIYPRHLIKKIPLRSTGFELLIELPLKVLKTPGIFWKEVPVGWQSEEGTRVFFLIKRGFHYSIALGLSFLSSFL